MAAGRTAFSAIWPEPTEPSPSCDAPTVPGSSRGSGNEPVKSPPAGTSGAEVGGLAGAATTSGWKVASSVAVSAVSVAILPLKAFVVRSTAAISLAIAFTAVVDLDVPLALALAAVAGTAQAGSNAASTRSMSLGRGFIAVLFDAEGDGGDRVFGPARFDLGDDFPAGEGFDSGADG